MAPKKAAYLFLISLVSCAGLFAQAKQDIATTIVIDNSASLRDQFDSVISLSKAVATTAVERGCIATVSFQANASAKNDDLDPHVGLNCSRDKKEINDSLDNLYIPSGGTTLTAALDLAVKDLIQHGPVGRKLIILISDGWDRSEKDRSNELLQKLKANHVQVFGISLPDDLPAGNSFSASSRAARFLDSITTGSNGGLVVFHRGDSAANTVKKLFEKMDR